MLAGGMGDGRDTERVQGDRMGWRKPAVLWGQRMETLSLKSLAAGQVCLKRTERPGLKSKHGESGAPRDGTHHDCAVGELGKNRALSPRSQIQCRRAAGKTGLTRIQSNESRHKHGVPCFPPPPKTPCSSAPRASCPHSLAISCWINGLGGHAGLSLASLTGTHK